MTAITQEERLAKRLAIHSEALRRESEIPGSYDRYTEQALRPIQLVTNEHTAPVDDASRADDKLIDPPSEVTSAQPTVTTTPKHHRRSFGDKLVIVADALDQFQRSRHRDAVYGFLASVYRLVRRYQRRHREKRLIRELWRVSGVKKKAAPEPFSLLMLCVAGPDKVDRKAISKWSCALRCAAKFKTLAASLQAFMKARGGINACAALYAKRRT